MAVVVETAFRALVLGAIYVAAAGALHAAGAPLTGFVKDENEAPVAGALITLRAAAPGATENWQTRSDAAGAFSLALPAEADYLINVQREDYFELKDRPIHIAAALEVTLTLNRVREVFQSVDVNAQPSPLDISQTRYETRLTGTEINDVYYPNSHSFRNSMKLMPGAVEDAGGGLHFNGSSENQVNYTLNGFNITDPVSGRFNTTLAVEGIRSADYASARYSPEFGKGTAGVLGINTENGTDAFHFTATNFIPGLQVQQGVRLGNWYGRLGVSGPLVRGKAWFSDSFNSEYTNSLVTDLPEGQNTRSGWAGSNLMHVQVNLSPRNILYTDFLVNVSNQGRVGLGPLDPVSTTQSVHGREYFGSLRDQIYLTSGYLLEFGYAHNEFSNHSYPQGPNGFVFSPQGRSGNYFLSASQTVSRDQGRVQAHAPPVRFFGTHELQAGADADLLRYNAAFSRTSYLLIGLSGQPLSQTSFFGPGQFGFHNTEVAAWISDAWRISKRFQIDAGLRYDWDRLTGASGWSPRVAFSWSPFADGHTRVAGGYSITHDAVPLDPFGRSLDQSASTLVYNAGVPAAAPVITTFSIGPNLKLPRAANWSLSLDHQFTPHLTASANYVRRRGTDGFNFINTLDPNAPPSLLPLPNGAAAGAYELTNLRHDDFDAVQLSVRQTFSGQYEWMAAYTYSRAQTNALLDINVSTPLQILPELVPMPWDVPHRFLAWTYLPLPWKKWAISALADARSGFPFSVQQQNGLVAGGVGSHRYPFNFDLNFSIERMVTLHGYRFALRGGVNNLTGSRNPTAVNNTIGSPQYLQFFGHEGRHFVLRIRFFGRAGTHS